MEAIEASVFCAAAAAAVAAAVCFLRFVRRRGSPAPDFYRRGLLMYRGPVLMHRGLCWISNENETIPTKTKSNRYARFRYLMHRSFRSVICMKSIGKKHGDARGWRANHVRYDISKVRYFDMSKNHW